MKRLSTVANTLLAAVALVFVPAVSASAASASGGTADTGARLTAGATKNTSCVITLAPLQRGQVTSRVISRTCADPTTAAGKLALASAAADNYLIFTVYEDTSYGGNFLKFNGNEPCASDNGGYSFPDTNPEDYGSINWQSQSWRASNFCWHTEIFYPKEWGPPSYAYPQGVYEAAQVGSGFNKHFWSVITAYSSVDVARRPSK